MREDTENGRPVASTHAMEIAVALVIMALAAVVIVSNYRLGASWDKDGPQTGYFPFYIGITLFISAAATLVLQIVRREGKEEGFVGRHALARVLQVLIPTIVYCVVIYYLGIYVATTLFIFAFMVWLGRYRIVTAAVISLAVSVALFLTFEVWFLVPLPKGPIETHLGY